MLTPEDAAEAREAHRPGEAITAVALSGTVVRLATAPPPLWSDLLAALEGVGKARNWFAEGAIEGNPLILFSGPEKSHKSWTAMQLAVATAIGGAWLGRFQIKRPGSVVYLDGEYGEHEFTRRIARIARGMGADPRAVLPRMRHLYSADLMLTKGDAALKRVLAEVKADPPAAIVLDPLRNHLAGDENQAQVIVEAFRSLGALRDAARCPLLVVHHLNKSGGFSGSRAITTRADVIIEGSDGETPTYKVRARTLRRTDAIAAPFTIEVSHENDDDDSIASTRLVHVAEGAEAGAQLAGVSALGRRALEVLRREDKPQTANYVATVIKCNGTRATAELEALVESRHAELVLGGVVFKGRAYDGYRLVRPTSTPDLPRPTVGRTDARLADDGTTESGGGLSG